MVGEGTMYLMGENNLDKCEDKPMVMGPDNGHKALWAEVKLSENVPRPEPPVDTKKLPGHIVEKAEQVGPLRTHPLPLYVDLTLVPTA